MNETPPKILKDYYTEKIKKELKECKDIWVLDLIYKLLVKSK